MTSASTLQGIIDDLCASKLNTQDPIHGITDLIELCQLLQSRINDEMIQFKQAFANGIEESSDTISYQFGSNVRHAVVRNIQDYHEEWLAVTGAAEEVKACGTKVRAEHARVRKEMVGVERRLHDGYRRADEASAMLGKANRQLVSAETLIARAVRTLGIPVSLSIGFDETIVAEVTEVVANAVKGENDVVNKDEEMH